MGGQLRAVAARAEGDILSRIATRPRPKHAAAIDRRAYPNSRRRRSCPPAPPKLPASQPKLPASQPKLPASVFFCDRDEKDFTINPSRVQWMKSDFRWRIHVQ